MKWGHFIYFGWRHCFKTDDGQGPLLGLIGWCQGTNTKLSQELCSLQHTLCGLRGPHSGWGADWRVGNKSTLGLVWGWLTLVCICVVCSCPWEFGTPAQIKKALTQSTWKSNWGDLGQQPQLGVGAGFSKVNWVQICAMWISIGPRTLKLVLHDFFF